MQIYIAEEQDLLRNAYLTSLAAHPRIQIAGCNSETVDDALLRAIDLMRPDGLLLGIRTLTSNTFETLGKIRETSPGVAFVVLFGAYNADAMPAFRSFTRGLSAGCALLSKHSVDTGEQLAQIIISAGEGRVVADIPILEGLFSSQDPVSHFVEQLSPRELEVLQWMARAYRNDEIAEVLGLDPRTVERHINNIFSKLPEGAATRHSRVYASIEYLKASGEFANLGARPTRVAAG